MKMKQGPPTIMFAAGTKVRRVPEVFLEYDTIMMTTATHEAAVVTTSSFLMALNGF
jgi:hypothetical protein